MKSKRIGILLISAACVNFGSVADNMSLQLKLAMDRNEIAARNLLKADNFQRMGVMIHVSDDNESTLAALEKLGFELDFSSAGYLVGSIPTASLKAASNIEGVMQIDLPNEAHPTLDKLRDVTGVDRAHRGIGDDFIPYRGKGVTVCVLDVGMDPTHPAFRDERTRKTRIKKYINTTSAAESGDKKFKADIYETPEEIAEAPFDSHAGGHGTHTSGIAVGGKVGNPYYGVAPDADIIMVSLGGGIHEDELMYGFDTARRYAEDTGKRVVTNMSIGISMGAHDGSFSFAGAIDKAAESGVVVCSSSGNEATNNMSIFADPSVIPGPYKTAIVNSVSGLPATSTHFQCWSEDDRTFDIQFMVVDKDTKKEVYVSPFFEGSRLLEDTEGSMYLISDDERYAPSQLSKLKEYFDGILIMGYRVDKASGKYLVDFLSSFSGINDKSHYYLAVGIRPTSDARLMLITDPSNTCMSDLGIEGYTSGTPAQSVSSYCINDNVISVGAWNARNKWDILTGQEMMLDENSYGKYNAIGRYSSYGSHFPADGRTYPTVAAPGTMIISALNSELSINDFSRSAKATVSNKEYSWGTMTGTSMSSPAVAGIVALWLEACPTLQLSDILEVMRETSVRDEFVEEAPERFGYGKINAYEGLKYILSKSGVETVAPETVAGLTLHRVGNYEVEVLLPFMPTGGECTLSDMQGSVREHLNFGETASFRMQLPQSSGIYLLTVRTTKGTMTEKIMVK